MTRSTTTPSPAGRDQFAPNRIAPGWLAGLRSASLAALLVAATGCASEGPPVDTGPPLPWARTAIGDMPHPVDNPPSEAKHELGRMLFYDPLLSRDKQVACATCHSEIWGMSDGLPLSVGVDGVGPVGPGRTGPNVTTRNAPTLWNVGYRQALFWDGRSPTLEHQALLPIENEVEMDRDLDAVLADLAANDGYVALFEAAFGPGTIDATRTAQALAVFQRSFITKLAPYDRYARGDAGALKEEALEGMFLFAEAGCATCHAPPLFESGIFANRGVGTDDPGHAEVSGDDADYGAFQTPTLRNLRETGPYFHDGSVVDLTEAVAHEVARSVAEGSSRPLSEAETLAIATFLDKGLMDRSLEPDRPEAVPSGLDVPLDGFRIPR